MRALRRTVALAGALIASTALAGESAVPDFAAARAAHRPSDLMLLDRHGAPLHRIRRDMTVRRLDWVRLDQVSPALESALLAAEDKRFYEHGGVDWAAAAQAAWDNLRGKAGLDNGKGVVRGASTLSMQLVALLDPALKPATGGRRNLGQKWDQARAAWQIERRWSKAQIFEAYLNLLPLRGETVGLAAASEVWFGKRPDGLDLAESALLAAMIRQPQASPARVAERACGIVAALDAEAAASLPRPGCNELRRLALSRLNQAAAGPLLAGLAPHVAQQVRAELARRSPGDNAVPLLTTLDARLQVFASSRLQQHLRELAGRNVEDGAALVLDNASGEVLAWVGSSANLSDAPAVDGVTALRQAGSTLKPFLYGLALERRLLTAASLIDDSPVALSAENGLYVPQNYDRQYRGLVSLRSALASSFNVPAIRTLLLTGPGPFYERLKAFGFGSLTERADYYGLALALGGAEVRLLDLANAYRALANGGLWSPVPALRKDAAAKAAGSRRVLSAGAAFIVGDILSDRGARAPGFGLENALSTRFWSAVKTGTSKDMRDNWAVGYTSRYTVAVWVGNFSGAPMWNVSGVHGAAPLWRDLVHFLHEQGPPSRQARPPAGLESGEVRFADIAEAARREWFLPGTAMSLVSRVGAAATDTPLPRIVYPAEGLVVALDPDIPPALERISLRMQPHADSVHWRLERRPAEDLRSGSAPCRIEPEESSWAPQPGGWRASLVDPEGRVVDAVNFSVRGSPRHPSVCGESLANQWPAAAAESPELQ